MKRKLEKRATRSWARAAVRRESERWVLKKLGGALRRSECPVVKLNACWIYQWGSLVTLALTAFGDWRCWGSNDRVSRRQNRNKEVEQALLSRNLAVGRDRLIAGR